MTNNKKTDSATASSKPNSNVNSNKESATDVIIRIWRVIVASSIAYAIVVIAMGTDGWIPKAMLIPALLHGLFLLIKR